MRYHITHTTTYRYEEPALLTPHVLRFRPRSDGYQNLQQYSVQITPEPIGVTHALDVEGNTVTRCWWADQWLESLHIVSTAQVETLCENPFGYLLEPWATHLPMDYPASLLHQLEGYLAPSPLLPLDPTAMQLAQELAHEVNWNTVLFLDALNQHIHQHCQYEVREEGDPLPPSLTWRYQKGTCRDFVVLFMAVCRSVGLAARFVSGYEEGDPAYEQTLHAWAEVYLPGAGWRGYDPTLGLVVNNRHVAIAASGWPRKAAPVSGSRQRGGQGQTSLDSKVCIQVV